MAGGVFQSLFGAEMPLAVRGFIALVAFVILLSFILWAGRYLLAWAFPPAKAKRNLTGSHYVGLRLISFLLRAVGWLSILSSLVIFLAGVFGLGQAIGVNFSNLGYGQLGPFITSLIISISVSLFMWGLFILALGELLKVLVDIALNTAPLPNIAEDINYFYQRLSPPQQQPAWEQSRACFPPLD
jgi:hypothetical protein